jgi:hypothetical protein
MGALFQVHTVAEKLIIIAAKIMAQIMLGEKTKSDKHQLFSRLP